MMTGLPESEVIAFLSLTLCVWEYEDGIGVLCFERQEGVDREISREEEFRSIILVQNIVGSMLDQTADDCFLLMDRIS
jgi:hypothetical protein